MWLLIYIALSNGNATFIETDSKDSCEKLKNEIISTLKERVGDIAELGTIVKCLEKSNKPSP